MAFVLGSNGLIGSYMLRVSEPGIVCMAGISDTTATNAAMLREANVLFPLQIAEDAARQGHAFIYASSASVYGNGDGPLNLYAESKADLDRMMQHYHPAWFGDEGTRVRWYGLRFFNVYGDGEAHKGKQASLVSRLLSGELKEVFALDTKRDFVHVSDCVSVARWLLQTLPPSGIYDVGTGVSRSIREVISLTGAKTIEVPMPKSLEGKYQFHTQADLTKLRAAGYTKPFLSLEEGLSLMRMSQAA